MTGEVSIHMNRVHLILVSLILAGTLSCCGAKSAPLPPAEEKPPTIGEIQAVSYDSKVYISWLVPKTASEEFKPSGFEVVRHEWPTSDPNPEQAKKVILADLEAPAAIAGTKAAKVEFVDEMLNPGHFYQYTIATYDRENRFSVPYVIKRFELTYPQDRITGLKVETNDGTALISWNPPPEQTAEEVQEILKEGMDLSKLARLKPSLFVNVYRARGKDGKFERVPINKEPLAATSIVDEEAMPGASMRYRVCAVKIDANGMSLQGPYSKEASALITDKTPPPAPEVLWSKAVDGGIRLRWKPVEDSGLLGYWLERKKGESFEDVSGFLTVDEFTDRKLPQIKPDDAPKTFVYRICARDKAGNASHSMEQKVEYPLVKAKTEKPSEAEEKKTDANSDPAEPALLAPKQDEDNIQNDNK